MLPSAVAVAVVSALESLPAGTVFHARYVYDRIVQDTGKLPAFGPVMETIEDQCRRLGQGYYQWGKPEGRVNMRLQGPNI